MGSNLMILTVFESKVAPPIAISFLSDVRKLFIEEIRREHGAASANNLAATIDQVSVAYQYIRLDRAIQRKRNEFKDSTRNDSLRRLNHSLDEVSMLMQRNINDLLMRGENLEAVSDKADQLRESSRRFARQARKLSKGAWLQTYGPFIAVGLVILIIIIVLML
ncbi:putative vesicle transport protein [Gregarina niphandrodes]|uniref:Vesicle transport protein n=1 Tax=Gregarina niphandrodes TaxID=110365 RepID=A0A023B1H1_GRENI|nr:putative vesicle transport protein [Gregarina niphandrodes]EZG46750.1 putative vesicle transport protein [Gregarina niphandrodes]|eukprot:XP_011132259.1 putative vesicle transport protein [Gregarina niphandrodes]